MKKIHARAITLEEYTKYHMYLEKNRVASNNYLVNNNFDGNLFKVYHPAENVMIEITKEGFVKDIPSHLEYVSVYSFYVIDLNTYNIDLINQFENNSVGIKFLSFGKCLNASVISEPPRHSKVSTKFFDNPDSATFKEYFGKDYQSAVLKSWGPSSYRITSKVFEMNILKILNSGLNGKCLIWEYQPMRWLYVKEENILISEYAYYNDFQFPLLESLEYSSIVTTCNKKEKKQENESSKVEELYNKIKTNVRKKRSEKIDESDKLIEKFLEGNNFDLTEYFDTEDMSDNIIKIDGNEYFGYDVNLQEYGLFVHVKPEWLEKLEKEASKIYPLNINLVIDLKEKNNELEIKSLIDNFIVHNKWNLPSNVVIILKGNHEQIKNMHNIQSILFSYNDGEFGEFTENQISLSINKNTKKNIEYNRLIIDNFELLDEHYHILQAGREFMMIKKEIPKIKYSEFYEELYLEPKRQRVRKIIDNK